MHAFLHTTTLPLLQKPNRVRKCSYSQPSFRHARMTAATAQNAPKPWLANLSEYQKLYEQSISDPDTFWGSIAQKFYWQTPPSTAKHTENFTPPNVNVRWFADGVTNISYNALDRWLEDGFADRTALICEGNEPGNVKRVSYLQLHESVCRIANVLKEYGVKKGDIVVLYLPMRYELPAAMLACARVGALHSVVFAGFSAKALAGRIVDSQARVVISATGTYRGKKFIPLKSICDDAIAIALEQGHVVQTQLVVSGALPKTDPVVSMNEDIDVNFETAIANVKKHCPPEWVSGEHPLFVLYTSGSTGAPKGVQHSTAGYMLYAATTFKYAFDYHSDSNDIFFSTSDCGWITGHTYVTYGPLLNCATQILHEGAPTYPNAGRIWEIVAEHSVTQLYTAPTLIRALKGSAPPPEKNSADEWVYSHDTSSLRVLGTVGEPIDAEAWHWYHNIAGRGQCRVVDTWWQTETGGHCILSLPLPDIPKKPGCAMLPFFGILPAILDDQGNELQGEASGALVIRSSWPSVLRSVYGDHARMERTYFERYPGYYLTGDGARRDTEGHFWLTGRLDDVLNVSGHRVGTAEIEAALTTHTAVAEAAVVGIPHTVKGEAVYAYVALKEGVTAPCESGDGIDSEKREKMKRSVVQCVRDQIGPFAAPQVVHFAPALPKTRSGKIMRRILRAIAKDGRQTDVLALGDTSTLTDPAVVDALLKTHGA